MKKALHGQKEVFLYERHGKVSVWDGFDREIVDCANRGLKSEPEDFIFESIIYRKLAEWMS